jgi:hypothetical protein
LIFNPQQKPRIFEILKTQGSSINEKLVKYGISGQDARFRIAQELLMKGKDKITTRKTPYRFCIPITTWKRFFLSDKSELYIIQCIHCNWPASFLGFDLLLSLARDLGVKDLIGYCLIVQARLEISIQDEGKASSDKKEDVQSKVKEAFVKCSP